MVKIARNNRMSIFAKKGEGLVVKRSRLNKDLFGIKSALNATEKASQQLFVLTLGAAQLHSLLTEP